MADVFVSYSRQDADFVRKLHGLLTAEKRDVWVDWEDIPPSAPWRADIDRAIEACDAFAFVISPASVASEACRREYRHALDCGKRIVLLLVRDVDPARVPDMIGRLNWLPFRAQDDFEAAYHQLTAALVTDLAWVRLHSRILVRATEWDAKQGDKSFLLAGTDLAEAEKAFADARGRSPRPLELQYAYIAASRGEQTTLLQKQLRGFYLVSLAYGLIQVWISYFVAFGSLSESALLALAPQWILGVLFGIFGLTLGRKSLRRAVVATVVAAGLLFVLYKGLWKSL